MMRFVRRVERCFWGAAALFFLVPLAGAWLGDALPAWLRILAAALVPAAISPVACVAVLLAGLTSAEWLAAATATGISGGQVADLFLLAGTFGLALRETIAPSGRRALLGPAAMALAAAIVASSVVELVAIQAVTPADPLLETLRHHFLAEYWTPSRAFPGVHLTWRWLAWLAAAVLIEKALAASLVRRLSLARLWIAAGAAGGVLAMVRLVDVIGMRGEISWDVLRDVAVKVRISVLHPDFNAAGSYYLLFILPALVLVWRSNLRWLSVACLAPAVAGFLVARSRAAFAALTIVAGLAAVIAWWQRRSSASSDTRRVAWLAGGGLVAVLLIVAAISASTRYSHASPQIALRIRMELVEVGVQTVQRYPMFGVGLGDYIRMTRRLITAETPALVRYAPDGENAHNNFLQIAVELGLPALGLFLWFAWIPVWSGFAHAAAGTEPLAGFGLAVAAFLLSALSGHPLLIPLVGTMFFLSVGVAVSARPSRTSTLPFEIGAAIALFYVLSLVWRLS